jgi:very-short-patch-repair endonuclease
MARRSTATPPNRRFSQNPGRVGLLAKWAELISKQTPAELAFEKELAKAGVRYRFQHLVWKYIPDFALPDQMILVELDGESHDTAEARLKDEEKTVWLKKQGWKVYRFRNEDALRDAKGCVTLVMSGKEV